MTPKPEVPLDIPCPKQNCHAAIGDQCWRDPPAAPEGLQRRPADHPHKVRVDRLEQARKDYDRVAEWRQRVLAPPRLTEGQPEP